MPIRLPAISFENPQRAQLNWSQIGRTTPGEIVSVLATLLRGCPKPDTALNYFERFNSTAPSGVIEYLARNLAALNILIPIFSHSHFLAETLCLYPEYVEWLHRDKRIEFTKSKEDLLEELSRFEATLETVELAERLARFKRREYLRIALRDITRISSLAETTWELSTLADVILEKALRWCAQKLQNRFGVPLFMEEGGRIGAADFVVIALGKLGGNELNYSSDIDLLYLYSNDGETRGIDAHEGTRISNQEYFIKLASMLNETVGGVTPSGWTFRVDLRLRPQGREGFLARSLHSAVEYYERAAHPWELQALLKARSAAGNLEIGKQLIQKLQSRIYPSEEKERIIQSIEQMRFKLDEKLQTADASEFNVKLARGTIRDIEFITQCLQRIHGAEDLWVREGNTVLALRRLHDNNHLSRPDFVTLASAYEFFRIVEHRLQLDRGEQTHRIPEDARGQQRLALCMGFEDAHAISAREAMLHAVEYHCAAVRRIYGYLFEANGKGLSFPPDDAQRPTRKAIDENEGNNRDLEELFGAVARVHPQFAIAAQNVRIESRWIPSFISFMQTLLGKPEIVKNVELPKNCAEKLELLFSSGFALAEISARHPEWLFTSLSWGNPRGSKKRSGKKAMVGKGRTKPKDLPLGSGKVFDNALVNSLGSEIRHRVFEILAGDVLKAPPVGRTLVSLSAAAEGALHRLLSLARAQLEQRASPATKKILTGRGFYFAVFALGRLATNELGVGSDLDLLFVSDYSYFRSREAVRETAFRLAETITSMLTSFTREGALYSVDLRLRPSGKEGELVQDAAHLIDYFRTAAQTWEHVAYLKLRPVGGDRLWARHLQKRIRETSLSSVNKQSLKHDMLEMRARLDQVVSSSNDAFDLKRARGGLYDIDFALGYSHLKAGRFYRSGATLVQAVQSGAVHGMLSKAQGKVFLNAAHFYRALDHSIRLIHGKAAPLINRKVLGDLPAHHVQRVFSSVGRDLVLRDAASMDSGREELMQICFQTAAEVREAIEKILGVESGREKR